MMRKALFITLLLMLLCSNNAYAYLGPGAGAGAITILLGFIASIFFAILAIVWYPLKRLFKKKDNKSKPAEEATQQ